jgi:hypothetical protein
MDIRPVISQEAQVIGLQLYTGGIVIAASRQLVNEYGTCYGEEYIVKDEYFPIIVHHVGNYYYTQHNVWDQLRINVGPQVKEAGSEDEWNKIFDEGFIPSMREEHNE